MLCLPAEVEHLLRFGDAADGRSGEAAPPHDQPEGRNRQRLFRRANEGEVAVAAQQIDVCLDVMFGGDSIENEIEAAGVLLHLVCIFRDDDLIRAQPPCVIFLVRAKS